MHVLRKYNIRLHGCAQFTRIMEPVRACPICPKCGSKRFVKLPGNGVRVKCSSCDKIIEI